MQVGDLIRVCDAGGLWGKIGIIIEVDRAADGILCFIKGKSLWLRVNQVRAVQCKSVI